MPCKITFPITEVCTHNRFGLPVKGAPGRAGRTIEYIVVHQLQSTMRDYDLEVQRDIPAAQHLGLLEPRSVHYVVAASGSAHLYVPPRDTAWGLTGINDPQITLPVSETVDTLDNRLLHVAFESGGQTQAGLESMANLICCLALQYNLPVTSVISAYQINQGESNLQALPAALVAEITTCIANGGNYTNSPSTPEALQVLLLQQQITQMQTLLQSLITQVGNLQLDHATILAQVSGLTSSVSNLTALVNSTASVIPVITGQIAQIVGDVSAIQQCLDSQNICPDLCDTEKCEDVKYQLSGITQKQLLTPNQPVRINMPNKIKDANPPNVLTGPLWTAKLRCGCNRVVSVNAIFENASMCEGKTLWLDMISTCYGRIRLATHSGNGAPETVTLNGSTVIFDDSNCDVYFEVGTDDLEPKTLQFAEANFACQ